MATMTSTVKRPRSRARKIVNWDMAISCSERRRTLARRRIFAFDLGQRMPPAPRAWLAGRLTDIDRAVAGSSESTMRRRAFIATLGGAAVWPLAARAEPQSAATIGLLAAASLPDWAIGAIRAGLSEAGYDESRNLTIISRSAEGHFDRLPE